MRGGDAEVIFASVQKRGRIFRYGLLLLNFRSSQKAAVFLAFSTPVLCVGVSSYES
jgi:hypothetical protein